MRKRWLGTGLFLTTLATLLLELLDARLLSVLTWYHLSFLALSLAMLGGSAGAVLVFLAGPRLEGDRARRALWSLSSLFALAIPLTHVCLMRLQIPALETFGVDEVWPLVATIVAVTIPFLLSGAVVTIVLTRIGGAIGSLYAADLMGAATGCALLIPLLHWLDILSALLVASLLAAAGAVCFARFAELASASKLALATLCLLGFATLAHLSMDRPIGIAHPRGRPSEAAPAELAIWNSHSYVLVSPPREKQRPFLWGASKLPIEVTVDLAYMTIDGEAGTALTRWDGDPESLGWVQYDVTTLPYHLRSGDVGIIGVGGGRDILSAIWAGATSITGIELNGTFLDILRNSHREFTSIAARPELTLVHDEARSYLTRGDQRFDVLQMSLVDTWASTGAGAFTLSENALYTIEGWRVFLGRLKPDGILSTSRWFSPRNASETSRLLSLGVATLLDAAVADPARHIVMLSSGRVATLLLSPSPFSAEDLDQVRDVIRRHGFRPLLLPGRAIADAQLRAIVSSRTAEELRRATVHADLDLSPPTDQRPYFFNMLKPGRFHLADQLRQRAGSPRAVGVVWGNLRATATLVALLAIASLLVIAIIVVPLLIHGMPSLGAADAVASFGYFAGIGYGFMSLQIAFLQRFSVYLGHPIYVYSVILMTMILCAGCGSALSDRFSLRGSVRPWHVPLTIATSIIVLAALHGPVLEATLGWRFPGRAAVVIALAAPTSLLLGFCFPIGMRLTSALSRDAAPWMWGINGAFGVLASILAVLFSMSFGIQTNLWLATVAYLGVSLCAIPLAKRSPAA